MTTHTTTTMARSAPERRIPPEHSSTILVPLDGSSYSEAILGTVDRLAQPLGARVTLLLVGDPQLDPTIPLLGAAPHARTSAGTGMSLDGACRGGSAAAAVASSSHAGVEPVLRAYLQRCVAALPGVEAVLIVDFAEDPAAVIIARARQQHVDLIAMATHGRTGLLGRLTGSVTARVIRSGVAPVVVLRP